MTSHDVNVLPFRSHSNDETVTYGELELASDEVVLSDSWELERV